MKTMLAIGRLAFGIAISLVLATGAFGQPSGQAQSTPVVKQAARQLDTSAKPWTGDFDQMLERRRIRVLVPFSRSLYFNDKGGRGASRREHPRLRALDQQEVREEARQAPAHRLDHPHHPRQAAPGGRTGLGDIAVGNLTVTEERLKTVDFASPTAQPGVKELVVTGPKSPAIASRKTSPARPFTSARHRAITRASRPSTGASRRREAHRETGARARRAGRRGHDGNAQRRSSGSRCRG